MVNKLSEFWYTICLQWMSRRSIISRIRTKNEGNIGKPRTKHCKIKNSYPNKLNLSAEFSWKDIFNGQYNEWSLYMSFAFKRRIWNIWQIKNTIHILQTFLSNIQKSNYTASKALFEINLKVFKLCLKNLET